MIGIPIVVETKLFGNGFAEANRKAAISATGFVRNVLKSGGDVMGLMIKS